MNFNSFLHFDLRLYILNFFEFDNFFFHISHFFLFLSLNLNRTLFLNGIHLYALFIMRNDSFWEEFIGIFSIDICHHTCWCFLAIKQKLVYWLSNVDLNLVFCFKNQIRLRTLPKAKIWDKKRELLLKDSNLFLLISNFSVIFS